jgi:hypothetical protein
MLNVAWRSLREEAGTRSVPVPQGVLANYQRVMREIFGIRHRVSITGPEGNSPADSMILNRIPRALLWAAHDPLRSFRPSAKLLRGQSFPFIELRSDTG